MVVEVVVVVVVVEVVVVGVVVVSAVVAVAFRALNPKPQILSLKSHYVGYLKRTDRPIFLPKAS